MPARPTWLPATADLMQRMPPRLRSWVDRGRSVARRAQEQGSSLDAAGMAFFAALAVGPAAVVIGSFAGLILTPQQITGAVNALARVLPSGESPLDPALGALVDISTQSSTQVVSVTSVIGVGVALYASSRFLYGMRLALQQAFAVTATRPGAMVRLTAVIGTVVGLLVATVILLLASVAGPLVSMLGGDQIGFLDALVDNAALAWVIVALVVAFVVRLALRRGPGVRIPVRLLSPAVLLATVWILGVSAGVTFYAARSSTLGVAIAVFGAPIVFLLWLYLCFIGILMAAHLHASGMPVVGSAGEPARRSGDDRGGKPGDKAADSG